MTEGIVEVRVGRLSRLVFRTTTFPPVVEALLLDTVFAREMFSRYKLLRLAKLLGEMSNPT